MLALAAPALSSLVPAGASARTPKAPSPTQLRTAVARAAGSRELWATVNICNAPGYANSLGIRAQMPALGFATRLSIRVQVDYWNFTQGRFMPDPGVSAPISLGRQSSGLHQGGVIFRFSPPVVLSGTVTFKWKLGNRVIGRAVRQTGHGYRGVDYGVPAGYSTATCRY